MQKLNVNYMYLEITRRCTLECAHCMRGERQNLDMSDEIITNCLKDVIHIHELDLGGGEPLLVPQVIEKIIDIIRNNNITVDKISFTTNGTVLTPKVIEVLRSLYEIAPLNVRFSHDNFHLLEIYLKRLKEIVDRNSVIFTDFLGYNPKDKDFVIDDGAIHKLGRAKKLTQDELDALNGWIYPTYYHLTNGGPNNLDIIKLYDLDKDVIQVCGNVVVSANGYLTQMDKEYEFEDEGPIFGINVRDKSLLEAVMQYDTKYKEYSGEDISSRIK